MGSVEQIIIKKNGGREGEIFECSGSTTRQKKTAPKSFAHFQFPPPFFKARFSLCVVWAHDVHRRRKHKTTKSPRGTNSLARRQTRTKSVCAPRPPATILRPRRGMSGSLSLGEKTKKEKGSCLVAVVAITTGGWERRFPARHRRCSLDLRGGGNRRSSLAGRGGQTGPRCGVGWWWEVMAGLVASGGSSSGWGEGDGWARRRMRRGAGPCSVQYVHRGEGREAGAKTTAAAASPTGGRSPSRRLPPPPPLPRPSLRPGSRPGRPCAGGRPPWGT